MYVIRLENETLDKVLKYSERDKALGQLYCYSGRLGTTTLGRAYINGKMTKLAILEIDSESESGSHDLSGKLPAKDSWFRISKMREPTFR